MIGIQIQTKKVQLSIDNTTAQNFCSNVLNILQIESKCTNLMSYLGAVYLYNKIYQKTNKKINIKIPLEYGIMLKNHCIKANTYHELEGVALYTIYEQLDKQINF